MDKKSQARYWKDQGANKIKAYWSQERAINRSKWFVEQIKNYEFDSIYEVGFFSGRSQLE